MSNKPYTTKAAVENYLGVTISSSLDTQMAAWILAMSRYADNLANRVLFDDAKVTLNYDGDGSDLIVIKDSVDIETVTVDGVAVEVLEYPQGKAYTSRIVLENGRRFTRGRQNVAVTAIQAMSKTLLPDVQQAVTVLVAGIYNARNAQGKVGTTETIGNYSVTYREASQKTDFETAKKILSSYRRIAL